MLLVCASYMCVSSLIWETQRGGPSHGLNRTVTCSPMTAASRAPPTGTVVPDSDLTVHRLKNLRDRHVNCTQCSMAELSTTKHGDGASQVVLVVKNPPANTGDIRDRGSILVLGRSPGEENGNPLQNSCLENSMDRGAWQANSPRGHRAGHG